MSGALCLTHIVELLGRNIILSNIYIPYPNPLDCISSYAAPEMLMAKKYLGPGDAIPLSHILIITLTQFSEVDIWSLGIILYCLLTGSLPFDDDDEARMREKIIICEFDIPEWLSLGEKYSSFLSEVNLTKVSSYRCPRSCSRHTPI